MSILYNKKATLYKYTRSETTGISTYNANGVSFACNIQPLNEKDGLEGGIMFKQKKMYCTYDSISVGDKVNIDGITYIIERFQTYDGIKGKYNKVFISESEGN